MISFFYAHEVSPLFMLPSLVAMEVLDADDTFILELKFGGLDF